MRSLVLTAMLLPLLSVLLHAGTPDDLNYAYLTAMGGSCYPEDSCHHFNPVGCRCDGQCERYGDCCMDAYQRTRMRELWSEEDWTCSDPAPNITVLVRKTCSPEWTGNSVIQRRCEDSGGPPDVLSTIPVTSHTSRITYRNYFCAICNEEAANSTFWDVLVDCESLANNTNVTLTYIYDSIEYDSSLKSWGLTLPEEDFAQFHKCSIHYLPLTVHQSIPDALRICNPDSISKCSPFWKDTNVRVKCLSYQAEMVHLQKTYRNIHCALCNFINIRNLTCPRPYSLPEYVPSVLHLVYNMTDGSSSIGESVSCGLQEIADPFYKRCRSLQCVLPGFSFVDGQCVTSFS